MQRGTTYPASAFRLFEHGRRFLEASGRHNSSPCSQPTESGCRPEGIAPSSRVRHQANPGKSRPVSGCSFGDTRVAVMRAALQVFLRFGIVSPRARGAGGRHRAAGFCRCSGRPCVIPRASRHTSRGRVPCRLDTDDTGLCHNAEAAVGRKRGPWCSFLSILPSRDRHIPA